MPAQLGVTDSNVQTALRTFLLSVLPPGTPVVLGQVNRVPEPNADDFVVFWYLRRERLETNTDSHQDVKFVGSIAGSVLTVSSVAFGTILPGSTVFGSGTEQNTNVVQQTSGTAGGVGTYEVSIGQTVASTVMSAGTFKLTAPTKITYQIDVHGPNAGNNAQIISTTFRDEYAYDNFKNQTPAYDVAPLYADDPRQMPFTNDQQQVETKWIVEAQVQANQYVQVPQQFADAVTVGLIEVDSTYPA